MRPSQLLAATLACSSFTAAWPDVFGEGKAIDVAGMLYPRQGQDKSESAQPSETAKPSDSKAAATTEAPKETNKSDSNDNKSSAKESGSQQASKGASKTSGNSKPSQTTFAADAPAGGIQMVTPAATDGAQYYKVGDHITFAWNYTSLSITPSKIDILASCSKNAATYTLALNHSAEETSYVWDTKAYQSSGTQELLTETYTLLMYDAESSVTAAARPGYLGTYNQFTFGMYTPQPYTPWADFRCATCSGALTSTERQTLSFLFGMSAITILSFTWFATGFGVF